MGFALYRSSAGSGKTYTLVKEYLKLALQSPNKFKHILAITFTNKAAAEMKARILQALINLSRGEDQKLAQTLTKEIAHTINLQRSSAEILNLLLHNYSDFSIMTIDSFIHRVIKAFALEIGLPLNFAIDLNYEKIQNHVMESLLAHVGRDHYITYIILEFIFFKILQEKSWNIESDIKEFEKEFFNEKNIDWISAIGQFDNQAFNQFIQKLKELRNQYIKKINQLGKKALNLIFSSGLEIDDFAYKKNGAAGFLLKCFELKPGQEKNFQMGSRFKNGIWTSQSTPRNIKETISTLLENGLSQICQEIIEYYHMKHPLALTISVVLDNIYLTAIIKQVQSLMEDYKKENNLVPLSEFNIKVYEIIKNSSIPFIYSILGEKFNHYLIDEFQDTSWLQWENLFPLIENSLASDFFNMAVGDGKQSIYRWRGGDVKILETDIKEKILPQQLKIKVLDTNYRSRKHIIEFNNHFFNSLRVHYKEDNRLLSGIYSDISQKSLSKEGGFVFLKFIEESFDSEEADEQAFQIVKTIISEALEQKYSLKDIAILVRETKKGQLIAEKLLNHHIPVISPDSLKMARIPIIGFLIDILKYLVNPGDEIAKAAIFYFIGLNHCQFPMAPDQIEKIYLEENTTIPSEISEFFKHRDYLIRLPVYEIVEEVIRIFNLDQQGKSLDYQISGYLQALLDIVADYSMENSVDISSFLDWWEFNKETFTLELPENKPAVKIMTIHKAKGLEFPIVIVPYAEWSHRIDKQLWLIPNPLLPTDPPLTTPIMVNTSKIIEDTYFQWGYKDEKDKTLIDNINLLYVAFTRAIDSLYIIAQQKNNNENYQLLKNLATSLMTKQDKNESEYFYGDPIKTNTKTKKKSNDIQFQEMNTLISNIWYPKITIRRKSKDFWKFDEGFRTKQRNWGLLLHQALSKIKTPKDAPIAIQRIWDSGEITPQEKVTLEQKIKDILNNPITQKWFQESSNLQILMEASIITSKGILRPDRVIINGDQVIIIDFKSGKRELGHRDQMDLYKNALQSMGYEAHHIDAYLLYLENMEVEKVSNIHNQ